MLIKAFILLFILGRCPTYADNALLRAEKLFDESLFMDALPIYEELAEKTPSPELLYRLAKSYEELGYDQQIISLTEKHGLQAPELIFLSAKAYKKLGKTKQAFNYLYEYLDLKNKIPLQQHTHALFEVALLNFEAGHFADAKANFTLVTQQNCSSLTSFSFLYLARLALQENQLEKAQSILKKLKNSSFQDKTLQKEVIYWLGLAYLKSQNYLKAIESLQNEVMTPPIQCLYSECYLKLASETPNEEMQKIYLEKAQENLVELVETNPSEEAFLALGECYLTEARLLNDQKFYHLAEALLAQQGIFSTPSGKSQAILLRAQTHPNYEGRDLLYEKMIQTERIPLSLVGEGRYLQGLNDYQEGEKFFKIGNNDHANKFFIKAFYLFQEAVAQLDPTDLKKIARAYQYQALSAFNQQTPESRLEAWGIIDRLIRNQKFLDHVEKKRDIYYLAGLIAFHLAEKDQQKEFFLLSQKAFQKGIILDPEDPSNVELLNLLGHSYKQQGYLLEAEQAFLEGAKRFPSSLLAGESWFWAASCKEGLKGDDEIIRQYKKNVYENYPTCRYAPEAYFTFFSYEEYLSGSRASIKHLEGMPKRFPQSPLIISAYYLMGLEHKKDRITPEGKILRRKNLLAAIEAFHEVETAFDSLNSTKKIPEEEQNYFINLFYRSILERALSNLSIAEDSIAAKKRIYLEYAEEVFRQVVNDFSQGTPLAKVIIDQELYPRLWEEGEFWLAHTYIQGNKDLEAQKVFITMLERYSQAAISKGYFLARTWFEKGLISQRNGNYLLALNDFNEAEKAASDRVLSTDQRLDLGIQQSLCYKELEQYEEAMLRLSQVINDDAISGLRVKAMGLRAEIYALQGRPELALKQWEATAKKGGKWGLKAQEILKKLEK